MNSYPKKCYESHPPLIIDGFKVYGGSCSTPIVKDADIYVGLDFSMASHPKAYPWEEGHSFQYRIDDMKAPSNPETFKKLISWLAVQVRLGHKVHIGCIGGHGRTGTVLAALVHEMTGNVKAIQYVRDNYCQKAVESDVQIKFLGKHYDQEPAEPTKDGHFSAHKGKTTSLLHSSAGDRSQKYIDAVPMASEYAIW